MEGGREGGREGGTPFPMGLLDREEKDPVAVALPLREDRGGFPLLLLLLLLLLMVVVVVVAAAVVVVLLRERAWACCVK